MKVGDLVRISPYDPTVGIYLSADPDTLGQPAELIRFFVLFDDDIYSVPAFQMKVINDRAQFYGSDPEYKISTESTQEVQRT
jgi:hypothetical protein